MEMNYSETGAVVPEMISSPLSALSFTVFCWRIQVEHETNLIAQRVLLAYLSLIYVSDHGVPTNIRFP